MAALLLRERARRAAAVKTRTILSVATLVGLIVAGYKYLDWNQMVQAWNKFTWSALIWLLLLAAGYLIFKAWRFVILTEPIRDTPGGTVFRGYAASQAASLLPGGFAARAVLLTEAGIPVERSVGPVLANSGFDQFVLLLSALVMAYWYPQLRVPAMILTGILALLVIALAYKPSRRWLADRLLRVAERFGRRDKVEEFEEALGELANWRIFLWSVALSFAALGCSYAMLCQVTASMGFQPDYWPLAAAYLIPSLLGRLSPLPAGAGVTEAGMVAFLAHETSLSLNQGAAIVAVFRVFDIIVPAFYGFLVHTFFWAGEQEPVARPAEVAA